jgi:hypothetical protein
MPYERSGFCLTPEEIARQAVRSQASFPEDEPYAYNVNSVIRIWSDLNVTCFSASIKRPKFILAPNLDSILGPSDKVTSTTGAIVWVEKDDYVLLVKEGLGFRELHYVIGHELVHMHMIKKYGREKGFEIDHGPEFKAAEPLLKKYPGMVLLKGSYKTAGLDSNFAKPGILS